MKRSVLVIDDEPDILDVFGEMLGSLGWRVFKETSGIKSLDLIKSKKFDLIIIDLIMPEKSGLEILEVMRAEDKKIPVILTAGVDINKAEIDFKEYGIAEFIKKPFTIDDLKLKLNRCFSAYAANGAK
jgi:DNA-binding NtrC family response regulator